jgi:toxin ParE1/3/4
VYSISEEAEEDILRIFFYGVGQFGVLQAEKYYHLLFEYFQNIADNPQSYERVDYIREGLRRCPCGSNSIYYLINLNGIRIVAVLGQQDQSILGNR